MSKSKLFLLGLFLFLVLAATHRANAALQIRIAVIDTGYTERGENLKMCAGHKAPADISPSRHGSNVAGIIVQGTRPSSDVCFLIYRAFELDDKGHLKFDLISYLSALQQARKDKATIVNISMSGHDSLIAETFLLEALLNSNITVVAASGNDGKDLNKTGCNVYPACADPRIIVVANSSPGAHPNIGTVVDAYEEGNNRLASGVTLSGTSQAAAAHTARIIRRFLGME